MRSATLSIGMAAIRHDVARLGLSISPDLTKGGLPPLGRSSLKEPSAELTCFDAGLSHWQLPVERPTKFELVINLKARSARSRNSAWPPHSHRRDDRMKRRISGFARLRHASGCE